MKEGWTYKKLGEVCEIFNGNSINADFKKKHFFGATGGLPFIATKDVSTNGSIDYDNGVRIPNYDEYKVAPANSVFVCSEGGSAGKKFAFVEQDVCFGNKLFCLNPKHNSLVGKYIYYFVQSDVFKDQFYALLSGLIGGVSAKKFQQIEIPVSSIDEQHSIVSRLDAAFAHVDSLKANAEKQLAEARQLFQAELAECMRQKEGWEEKKMSDFFEITSSKRVFQKDWTTSGIPFYRAREIVKINKQGFVDNELFITEEMYEEYKKKYGVPQIGDILITGVGTLGVCYVIKDSKKFYYKDGNIIWLKKKSSINSDFVTYQYLCPSIKKQIYKTEGATVGTYTITNANDTKILVPSIETQNQIVSRLDALSANIKKLEEVQRKTLAECDALKQAMLREVFQ